MTNRWHDSAKPAERVRKKTLTRSSTAAAASAGSQTLSINSTGLSDSKTATLQHPFDSLRLTPKMNVYRVCAPIPGDFCRTLLPACRRLSFTVSWLRKKTTISEMALVKSRSRRVKLPLWVPAARQKNARLAPSGIAYRASQLSLDCMIYFWSRITTAHFSRLCYGR